MLYKRIATAFNKSRTRVIAERHHKIAHLIRMGTKPVYEERQCKRAARHVPKYPLRRMDKLMSCSALNDQRLLQNIGESLTLEDTYHLQSLLQKLKMIEKRQSALRECVEADVKKVMHHRTVLTCATASYTPSSALVYCDMYALGCPALCIISWLGVVALQWQSRG